MTPEEVIREFAQPINIDLLLNSIDNNRLVLVGDNTHGTREFYKFRKAITKKLITEKGFTIVGVEWDWVDIGRINNFILGRSQDRNAHDAISPIDRFPEFMYDNHEFEEFIEWLHRYNQNTDRKVTIYGLDIFGLIPTIRYLMFNLPDQNRALLEKINSVFSLFSDNEYAYGYAVQSGQVKSLENEVNQLQPTGDFFLDQCIQLLKEGERYYRIKAQDDSLGWNIRDHHMARIIIDLLNMSSSKMVGWLHNTHSGDARTVREFKDQGKTSVCEILRKYLGNNVYSIGLLTYTGTVTASDRWFGPTIKFKLNPSIEGSFGDLFHDSINGDFMLILRNGNPKLLQLLSIPRYERFIGGAYNPNNELHDHYVHSPLYNQFDAIIFYNYTHSFE